jgi:SnoaL-like domain
MRLATERSGQRPQRCRGAEARTSLPVAQVPERVVSRWVDAFNARDLEDMLMRLDPRVDFHPLRLGGLGSSYRGHDGVRDWWLQTMRQVGEYQIGLSDVRSVGEGEVFAVGSLHLAGERHIGSFSALHRIDRGLIVAAYHCLTDPEMIESLGLIP